jgi:hypothetical protein
MQDPRKPTESLAIVVDRPATIGEVAFEGDVPREIDDRLVLLGGVLLAAGWSAEVDLEDAPALLPAESPGHADGDGEASCGGPDAPSLDEAPTVEPVVTVVGIQQRLAWLGYYDSVPTGVLDAATRDAIHRLQIASNIKPTGLPDGPTRDALVARFGW